MSDSNTQHESEYLGITEAAEYLRVSASTLRRWEKKGFLVPERTPTGIRRYTKQQLDSVMQAPEEHMNAKDQEIPHEAAQYPMPEQNISYPVQPDQETHETVQNEIDSILNKPEQVQDYSYPQTQVEHYQQDSTQTYTTEEVEDDEPAKIEHFGPHTSTYTQPTQSNVVTPTQAPVSNVEPLSQSDFETMFHLEHTMSVEEDDMNELEEYDNDAAVISPSRMTNATQTHPVSYSSYRGSDDHYEESLPVKEKRTNPILLLVGIFATVVVLAVAVWLLLSLGSGSGELLNPVVQ